MGSSAAAGKPQANPIAQLLTAAHQAYVRYPRNCSGAVHYVITKLVDPKAPYRLANQLMTWFASPNSGWRQVLSLREASRLADQGKVVVAGLASKHGNGHVIVVLPGAWRPAGGYVARGRRLPESGSYPRAMSTSLGPWPGAMSDDDKTVRDPWSAADWHAVTFWTPR